jgi:diaminopimelate epimerase
MRFTKMHGVGNDFIVFDPGEVEDADLPDLAREACDRHFGVGADGILVPAASEVADLKMVYLNSDGSPSEMCGNGLRCLARYARDFELVNGEAEVLTIETGAGVKKVTLCGDGSSRVDMGAPEFEGEVELHGFSFLRVSMGNPHAVAFLGSETEVEELDLKDTGALVEKNPLFPEGTNVEFAHPRGWQEVRMRIWERGVGETLASGSGSCATAVAAIRRGLVESPVAVRMDGGTVRIEWSGEDEPVYMVGPAEYVCEGELLLRQNGPAGEKGMKGEG